MTSECYGDEFHRGFSYTVRYLRSRGASWERAEEAAQAAWAKGWERLAQLRNDCMVRCWVNAIALNELRVGFRKASFDAPLVDVCGEVGVDFAAIDAAAILERCHPRDRALFTQQLRGLTTDEIASATGATSGAVRLRLLRARRSARRIVEPPSARRGATQPAARRKAA